MRALLPFLAGLMLVLAGWASMAQATEICCGEVAALKVAVHAPGDQTPADGSGALPHHHRMCHGHDVGTPATTNGQTTPVADMRARPDLIEAALAGVPARVLPRPPRA